MQYAMFPLSSLNASLHPHQFALPAKSTAQFVFSGLYVPGHEIQSVEVTPFVPSPLRQKLLVHPFEDQPLPFQYARLVNEELYPASSGWGRSVMTE